MTLDEELRRETGMDTRFDDAYRALYATDASNYRQVPIGVLFPRSSAEVAAALAICRKHGVPVLSRGAGTSLAGQCCNTAVIFDFSRYMNRILEIDAANRIAIVEPGVVLDHLRSEAEKYGLTFGPDPATHSRCTLGGMMGNNSCGVHALMAGKTVDNVESLEILTYEGLRLEVGKTSDSELASLIQSGGRRGQIYSTLRAIRDREADRIRARYPKIPRRVSGYNLDELLPENGFHVARSLIGSEGTCVTILKARLRLIQSPPHRQLLVLGFPDIYQAAEAVPAILEKRPIGLEGMDLDLVTNLGRYQGFTEKIRLLPQGEAWLLVEYGGNTATQAMQQAIDLLQHLKRTSNPGAHRMCRDAAETQAIWSIRESVLAATAFVPGQRDRHEGWEDTAVPPEKLAPYLKDLRTLYEKFGYRGAFYGHFGEGCLHTRIDFDLETAEGRQKTRAFLDEGADLVVRYGGSLSGEHGDGQARAELLPKMFGPELVEAFREFKRAWDPENRMNPGKVVDAYGILDHLRTGGTFHPAEPNTHFRYPKQENSFVRAILRCVGVGKCRNEEGGAMCPSYQVTRDEKHSTRGRAHLLFEMLQGDVIHGGWKSEEVKEALDECLSCKGCKSDCPTNVDMATYKAEFLSHYFEGRLRPQQAYTLGLVFWWARLGSIVPGLANFFTQTPGLRYLAKTIAGVAPERSIPRLAPQTFRRWFTRRPVAPSPSRPLVLLWPDTFNNHFTPGPAEAATEVLERLGYRVTIPSMPLCCGRPLYDHGMLDLAKRQLRQILDTLKPQIEAGLPLIGLEPGCVSVFRDELLNLYPEDPLALKLSRQTFLLSEFLETRLPDTLRASGTAIVQGHCHQKSVLDAGAEERILKKLGLRVIAPESGCCGMAGAFGFDADHLDLSQKLGERFLLPAIRKAPAGTVLIASGFSCREQIRQGTGRSAKHLAEILREALKRIP